MKCPECDTEMENGFVTAGNFGITWQWKPSAWFVGRNVEFLQKDWWGFPKLTRTPLVAYRCRSCKLLIARYNRDI